MTELQSFLEKSSYRVVGITGTAGAGKTTIASRLSTERFVCYSFDARFVGDSEFRRRLLKDKAESSISAYIDACNQFNWWDWDAILSDIRSMLRDESFTMNAYDRDTGLVAQRVVVPDKRLIVCEGALLGPEAITELLDVIIFVYEPINVRFKRIMKKDAGRRSLIEILARFMITEYSEQSYYHHILNFHNDKLFFVDTNSKFIPFPEEILTKDAFIPVPI